MVHRAIFLLDLATEALLVCMICISPWAIGAVGALPEFWLLIGIGLLLILWAARSCIDPRPTWKKCPVAMCLAVIVLLGTVQLVPLPEPLLDLISPGAAKMYDRLLPAQPEVLEPNLAGPIEVAPSVGSTLSLYPGATRQSLLHLLAVLALFLIVRNNWTSIAAMRRLCVALLINGAALSLFGLIRFFSVPQTGTFLGSDLFADLGFGTFVNRNHFAFYINLCIGAAVGLLLARSHDGHRQLDYREATLRGRVLHFIRSFVSDPTSLWMAGGLTLMVTSVVICMSRGGFLAMLGAATTCVVLMQLRGASSLRLIAVVLSTAAALALLVWFGVAQAEARLGTLLTGEAIHDGRVYVLTHSWPLIRDFPLLGTGYGTFQFVEPLQLHTAADVGSIYEHAHNDYLEDLIEGGLMRLSMRLLAIALILRCADRAFRLHIGTPVSGLVLGLLFAFTSVVIHSFFEFGLYIPSIVVLATVLSAQLCTLSETPSAAASKPSAQAMHAWPGAGQLIGAVGLCSAIVFAWLFYSEGIKAARVDALRSDARKVRRAAAEGLGDRSAELPMLQAAAQLEPNDAERRFALAQAYFEIFKQQLAHQEDAELEHAPDKSFGLSAERYLGEALRQVVYARNLCPLLPEPHTRIASYVKRFASADPRSAYMARAKFLAPADPQLWYLCGLQELTDGQHEHAWASWKQSLQLSDHFLTRILDRAATHLSGDEILERILPDRAEILLSAAMYLYPAPENFPQRKPLLEKALAASENTPAEATPTHWHTRAMLYTQLAQPAAALDAFEKALSAAPQQIAWRYEFAEQLHEAGRTQDARRQLTILLSQQPSHAPAKKLMAELKPQN